MRKRFWDGYNDFNLAERVALITVIAICWLCWTTPLFWHRAPLSLDPSSLNTLVDSIQYANNNLPDELIPEKSINLNEASVEVLSKIGIPTWLSKRVVKYRERVQSFQNVRQLSTIYGMTDSIIAVVEPFLFVAPMDSKKPTYVRYTEKNNAKKYTAYKKKEQPITYFNFDWNTITKDSLVLLGLSPKKATILINYRDAVNGFRQYDQLTKVYGLSPKWLDKVSPYGRFSRTYQAKKQKGETYATKEDTILYVYPSSSQQINSSPKEPPVIEIIDINIASSEQLQSIKGIGPSYSKRIIKYRDLLGGFYDTSQYREVYGLPEEIILALQAHFTMKQAPVTIEINTADFKTLLRHPYIRKRNIRPLQAYIKQHGGIPNFETFSKIATIKKDTIAMLEPYLSFPEK